MPHSASGGVAAGASGEMAGKGAGQGGIKIGHADRQAQIDSVDLPEPRGMAKANNWKVMLGASPVSTPAAAP